ncbi:hypothetical protein IWW38_006422, partial [Coemansia aciculifera]
REWAFKLGDTLCKARELNGSGLQQQNGIFAGFCVYVAANVARPDPACLSVMVKSAGGFVLNDFARDEERLLRGEDSATARVGPFLSRRSASATIAVNLLDNSAPTLAECVLLADELAESSTEPDNDSDEDYGTRTSRVRGRQVIGPKKRKTLPKLPKIKFKSNESSGGASDDDGGDVRVKLKSEPSMIFAPPHPTGRRSSAATTPVRSCVSPSAIQQHPLSSSSKRRRIEESPSISATAMHFGSDVTGSTTATTAAGSGLAVSFDPQCSCQDMAILLAARKEELGIPADAQLLVVSASTEQALQKMWKIHGALVVEPELIIQSIIHCSRQF